MQHSAGLDVTRQEALLFSHTKLSYLGEHSEVSKARPLHERWTRMLYHDRLETNRKLPKHKLSQNAKNLQCLLKFGFIEDNVKKNYEFLRKCFFREKDS